MATYPFQYSDLKASINYRIHNKFGLIATPRIMINDIVNEVSGLYLRSAKRKAVLAPNLFNDIYQYGAPTDLDGSAIVDLEAQSMERDRNNIWELISEGEFDLRKQTEHNLIALSDNYFVRKLLISADIDDRNLTVASLDSTSADGSSGSWSAFGDATNITTDTFDFIKGSGSVKFDLSAAGGTTAGLTRTVNTFDITEYKSNGSVFVWAKIYSATNITNYKLRLGSSSGNYYEVTATTVNEGTAFVAGWNLLRFDLSGKTTTGTPTDTSMSYVAIYMTKTSGKISEAGYGFDHIIIKLGSIQNLIYYSSYPWQNIAGTLIAESTADTDYIVCDQDEYQLMVEKGVEIAGMAAREYQDSNLAMKRYEDLSAKYKRNYPTERLVMTSSYYYMNSRATNRGGFGILS